MEKLKERKECTSEPVKAKRWRNLYFFESGKTAIGDPIYPSQDEAEEVGRDVIDGVKSGRYYGLGREYPRELYPLSHFISMPVGDA